MRDAGWAEMGRDWTSMVWAATTPFASAACLCDRYSVYLITDTAILMQCSRRNFDMNEVEA